MDWQRLESPAKQGLHLQLQDSVNTAPEKVPYMAQDASVKELKKKRARFVWYLGLVKQWLLIHVYILILRVGDVSGGEEHVCRGDFNPG